ncbi:MMPL/RND family transporter [Methanomassiliicoccus luminyensis]|uniref:MMPL/RND family transporter n=1 Tax=Methanomassiliicoccus luminyensis TaxID=1080712 RepID=UPI00037B1389|nr:MMPL family transporter [Methanomassiliicoccus luminyensis]
MLFDKIANFVTKRYKLVIVIWIAALLIAVPAILKVNEAVQYSSNFGATGDYESTKAQEVIDANFQGSVANGTMLIVIQADNVTDAEVRAFVIALEQSIRNDADIKYKQDVSSIYTYSYVVMDQAITQLGPGMHQINSTAALLWGIPAMHVQAWSTAMGSTPDPAAADTAAYQATMGYLSTLPEETRQMAVGYYNAFAGAWNASSSISDPVARAENSVRTGGLSFINTAVPEGEQRQLMVAIVTNLDFTTGINPEATKAFAINTIATTAGVTNTTFLGQVYDMGPNYDPAAVSAMANAIVAATPPSDLPVVLPEQLTSGFISPNKQTMLMMVTFTQSTTYTEEDGTKPMMDNVVLVRDLISSSRPDGVTAYVTGDAAISQDMMESSADDMSMIEPITIIIIVVLMGVLFRSVLAEFLPLGAVGVAVGLSQAVVFVIGSTFVQVDSMILTLLFAILMGVGTDYSIFVLTRYREERIRGATREQAVHTSVAWAGESIVTSGATVIIAFFAMTASTFSFVQTMGLVLGISIVIALLVALTLVPAVLMVVGNRLFWPNTGERFKRFAANMMEKKKAGNHGYFHRAATFATDHAVAVLLAAVLVSVPATYIYLTQETSFDFIGTMGDPESIQGMNAMTDDFGAGMLMPTQIVITGDTLVYDPDTGTYNAVYLDAIDNITTAIAANDNVQEVTGITRPFGDLIDYRALPTMSTEERVQYMAGMNQSLGSDGKSVLLTVVLKEQPQKASSVDFMPVLRQELADAKAAEPALADSTVLVGGSTAALYDTSLDTSQQFTNIQIIVLVGIFVVLLIVLGSVLLPLFAIISIAMSISWAFAITSLVFGTWLSLPILWIVPLVLFVMLMGIGMDYNVFILTRIREEVHKGKDTKTAVVDAVDWTGGIITALALIMAGTFGSIMISSNAMLQEFGFALALAVLLDAMVVRTYIVPAALMLMGKWAWWAPGRLQRVGRKEKMEAKSAEHEESQ